MLETEKNNNELKGIGMSVKKINEICTKASSNLKQKDVEGQNGEYPVYGAGGLISKVDFYHQEKEYIAIVKDGSGIGRVSFLPPKSSVIGTMQYILPVKGFDIKYVCYCLQSLDLSKYKQGAAIPHIYFKDYGERLVNVTEDETEQSRIVAQLDEAFAKIDALKENAQKGLQAVKDLWQATLKEELKPKEGWCSYNLKSLCSKIGSGATPNGGQKSYISEGISLIRSLNVWYNKFEYKDLAHINEKQADSLSNVTIENDDVLFNITGASIARCCVVPSNVLPARVNQHVSILRAKKDILLPNFLCYVMISPYYQKQLLETGEAGATRQALTKAQLENFVISIPSLVEQKEIVEKLGEISEKCKIFQIKHEQEISEYEALKQSILRKAFSGEL